MSRKVATRCLTVLALVFALGVLPAAAYAAETSSAGGADGATTGGGETSTLNGDEGASIDPHG